MMAKKSPHMSNHNSAGNKHQFTNYKSGNAMKSGLAGIAHSHSGKGGQQVQSGLKKQAGGYPRSPVTPPAASAPAPAPAPLAPAPAGGMGPVSQPGLPPKLPRGF